MISQEHARFLPLAGKELDGGEASDAKARAEVLVARVVGVKDGHIALLVVLEGFGDLGPGRLEVFAVLK